MCLLPSALEAYLAFNSVLACDRDVALAHSVDVLSQIDGAQYSMWAIELLLHMPDRHLTAYWLKRRR